MIRSNKKVSELYRMIAQCPVFLPKWKTYKYWQNSLEKQKLSSSRSALFHIKTRVSIKYFVNGFRCKHTTIITVQYLKFLRETGGNCNKDKKRSFFYRSIKHPCSCQKTFIGLVSVLIYSQQNYFHIFTSLSLHVDPRSKHTILANKLCMIK